MHVPNRITLAVSMLVFAACGEGDPLYRVETPNVPAIVTTPEDVPEPNVFRAGNVEWVAADPIDRAPDGIAIFVPPPAMPRNEPEPEQPTEPGNLPPVAVPGIRITADDIDGDGSATVDLDGSHSYDLDGQVVAYAWTFHGQTIGTTTLLAFTATVGTHHVWLEVTDNRGATDANAIDVIVRSIPQAPPNVPPVADPGPNIEVVDTDGDGYELVTINGFRSHDPDGTIVAYRWFEAGQLLVSVPQFTYGTTIGSHTLILEVEDNRGAIDRAHLIVTIAWNPPDACRARRAVPSTSDYVDLHEVTITATQAWFPVGSGFYNLSIAPIPALEVTVEKSFDACAYMYREYWTQQPQRWEQTLETRWGTWYRQRSRIFPIAWCWDALARQNRRVYNTPFTDAVAMTEFNLAAGDCVYVCHGNDPNTCSDSVVIMTRL